MYFNEKNYFLWKRNVKVETIHSNKIYKHSAETLEAAMLELIGLDQLTNVNKGKISKLEKFTRNEINTMAIYGLMKLYCNFVDNTNTNINIFLGNLKY